MKYDTSEIQVLSLMDAIRKRPGMYIGPLEDPLCPNRLLQETMCKAISDGFDGLVTTVSIDLFENGRAAIRDDGPGWPTDLQEAASQREGREVRYPEIMLTALFACREAKEGERKGLCNNGIVTTNALSSSAKITIRNAVRWEQDYRCGVPQGPLAAKGSAASSSTQFEFTLDETLLPQREFQLAPLVAWCLEMGGPSYDIADHRTGQRVQLEALQRKIDASP